MPGNDNQVIVVQDLEAPMINDLPPDITISCSVDIPPMENITWTDNCDGSGNVTGSNAHDGSNIYRTWTYNDGCANTSSVTQSITLLDTSFVTVYDNVSVMDTTYIEVTDTNYITIYDTVSISVTDTLYIEVATTGTDNSVVKGEIKIYPNPSNDVVIIAFIDFDSFSDFSLDIINVNGTKVYDTRLNQERIEILVSDIGPPGIYFVNIVNGSGMLVAIKTLILI